MLDQTDFRRRVDDEVVMRLCGSIRGQSGQLGQSRLRMGVDGGGLEGVERLFG